MSSNTIKRIISAFALIIIVSTFVYFGRLATLYFVALVGVLTIDEIHINFFKYTRTHLSYIFSQLIFMALFYLFSRSTDVSKLFVATGIVMNIGLLWYLFKSPSEDNLIDLIKRKLPILTSLFVLMPMMSLAFLLGFDNWRLLLLILLVVNFGMDSGAWFFGKSFGRTKLWPEVSPNKTREGLFGGMATAGTLGGLLWFSFFNNLSFWVFIVFSFLGLISQIGDLIQSKLKRQFGIKDSSALIPGHGGIYDRIDSLIFVLPFFTMTIYYYY